MTATSPNTPDARAVVAMLANGDTRRLFALVALGLVDESNASSARDERAITRLLEAGLLVRVGEALAVNSQGLAEALSQYSGPKPRGIARFVRDGRIVNYPASDEDRLELLMWVGSEVLEEGERVSEREINERLHRFMDEHVLLRRFLIDYGVVQREDDGTNYTRRTAREE